MAKWYTSPVLKALKKALPEKGYTFVGRMPFQTIGDAKHSARKSDHNPDSSSKPPGIVRAADIFLSRDELAGLAEAIRKMKPKFVKYLIFDGRMWSSYPKRQYPPFTWRPYSNAKKMPHDKHIHLSTNKFGDHMDASAWHSLPVMKSAMSEIPGKSPGYDHPVKAVNEHRVLELILSHPKQAWGNLHETTKAVQELVGSKPDGIVGPRTRAAIAEYFEGTN